MSKVRKKKDGRTAVKAIEYAGLALIQLVQDKNRRYGDALGIASVPEWVLAPECKTDPTLGIRLRIDEKLARLRASEADENEDVVLDLAGLFLVWLAQRDYGA